MLRAFHKYQKSFLLVILALIVCFAMLFFGLNPYGSSPSSSFAIRINDQEITQEQFYNAQRNLEQQYRSQLGSFFDQLVESGGVNIAQQTIDRIVVQTLLKQFANIQDLHTSKSAVNEAVLKFFGENYSTEAYKTFLNRTGQTAQNFEAMLSSDVLPEQLNSLIADHIVVTKAEVEHAVIKAETTRNLHIATFTPETYLAETKEASEEEILSYYEDNAADYELPEMVRYNHVVIDPEENLDLVEVLEEDIEIYYADNQDKFKEGEELKPLQEVAAEIKATIQKEQAPAYVLIKAEDLLAEWKQSGSTLEDFSKEHNLKFSLNKNPFSKETYPDIYRGLSAKVLSNKGSGQQLQEVGDIVALVEVQEFLTRRIPDLGEVREDIKKDLKKIASEKLAQEKAEEFLKQLEANESDFAKLAEGLKASVELREDVKPADRSLELSLPTTHSAVFEAAQTGLLNEVFDTQNTNKIVIQIEKITPPSSGVIAEKVDAERNQQKARNLNLLISSLINKLKAEAEIEIAPGLL